MVAVHVQGAAKKPLTVYCDISFWKPSGFSAESCIIEQMYFEIQYTWHT